MLKSRLLEPAVHVVCRVDGTWQVERESGLLPLSLHPDGGEAMGAACDVAAREHCGISIHRRPRHLARRADVAVRSLLRVDPDARELLPSAR